MSLVLGLAFGLLWGNPLGSSAKRWNALLLQASVIGMGAGIPLEPVIREGVHGFFYTFFGIAIALVLGMKLGHLFKVERTLSLLLSTGTAICGGSAIAAVAPVLKARDEEITISMATVFLLNAVALLIFPWLGRGMGLEEGEFGLWCALAIHDTSSVVGAAMQFGHHALEVAVPVKLTRALWIVPTVFVIGYLRPIKNLQTSKSSVPWFILGFVAITALFTALPSLNVLAHPISTASKRALVLTLFFIGSGLSRATLRNIGVRPFFLGISLWVILATTSLFLVRSGWV